jgi:hypothetical protein
VQQGVADEAYSRISSIACDEPLAHELDEPGADEDADDEETRED